MKRIEISKKMAQNSRQKSKQLPKHVSPLLNHAAQTAHATRPKNVGQMSELMPNYIKHCELHAEKHTLDGWRKYYLENFGSGHENAYAKLVPMIENYKTAINSITDEMIKEWIDDVLINKTYEGFVFEDLLHSFLRDNNIPFRKASKEDEAKYIDIWIKDIPFQIKPESIDYKSVEMSRIGYPIIYYTKDQNGKIVFYCTEDIF